MSPGFMIEKTNITYINQNCAIFAWSNPATDRDQMSWFAQLYGQLANPSQTTLTCWSNSASRTVNSTVCQTLHQGQ